MESKTPLENKNSKSDENEETLLSIKNKIETETELKRSHFTDESLIIIDRAKLICPICFSLLTDPKQVTPCGHVFCGECISRSLANFTSEEEIKSNDRCPICRKTVEMLIADNNVKMVINGLIVHCKYRSRGCSWQNAISDYIRHITSCPLRGKICAQGCGVIVEWDDEKNHQLNNCSLTLLKCEYNECHDSILRKDFADHLANCNYRLVDCEFKFINLITHDSCDRKIQYRHYHKHLMDCAIEHSKAASRAYEEMKNKWREEKKVRENLDTNVERLTGEKEKLSGEKRRAEEKVDELEKKAKAIDRHRWVIRDWSKIKIKEDYCLETSDFYLWGQIWKMKLYKRGSNIRIDYLLPYITLPLTVVCSIVLVNPKSGEKVFGSRSNPIKIILNDSPWGLDLSGREEKLNLAHDQESDSIYIDLLVKEEPRLA